MPSTLLLLTLASVLPVQRSSQDPDAAFIEAGLARARATAAEMRWRLVPWMRSLGKALARGKKENKPVFYFGYDGVLDSGNS